MNTSKQLRRLALALTISGSTMILAPGCTSPDGLSGKSGAQASPLRTVTQSTKNAWTTSRNAVAGVFKRKDTTVVTNEVKSSVDPLRLDKKTEVGPEVFVANGRLWESSGNRQKAMESYTKALSVKPNHPQALASIARLHNSGGNYPEAINFFNKAIQQDPKDSTLYNDLGLTLNKSGDTAGAVAALTKALEISPGTSRYGNNLASVKFELGETASALKVLQETNKPAIAHYNMAYLFEQKGQLDQARKHLNEAIKYKNEGQIDSSIARAVNRSQELLAKIGGGTPATTPSATKPSNTAIVKSTVPTTGKTQAMIRQTSQAVDKTGGINVLPAMAKQAKTEAQELSNRRVQANFATARLGPKTETTQSSDAEKAADAPQSLGAFSLPPGFGG